MLLPIEKSLRYLPKSNAIRKQQNQTYEDGCKAMILVDAATESAKHGKL